MRFVKIWDSKAEHNGIEVLLCECYKENNFVFYTGVRVDWAKPRGSFTKEQCPIVDLDHQHERDTWHVFYNSSSHLINELRGKYIDRTNRLKLLLGYEVIVHGWTIKPAG